MNVLLNTDNVTNSYICDLLCTDPPWGAGVQNVDTIYKYDDGEHLREEVIGGLCRYARCCVLNACAIACDDRWLPHWHIGLRNAGFNTKTLVCEQRLGKPSKSEFPIKHYYYVIGEKSKGLYFDYSQWMEEDRRANLGSGERMMAAGIVRATMSNTDPRRVPGFSAQKLPEVVNALIRCYTKPGQIVCDPYMGTGTTIIEAVKLSRGYVGYEKNPETFKMAMERIKNAS